MKFNLKKLIWITIGSVFVFCLTLLFYINFRHEYLSFSDAAKFADIARNLLNSNGYSSSFTFFSRNIFEKLASEFVMSKVPPMMPVSILISYKIFGVKDFAVLATSFFYFTLSLIFTFLLAKKIFKNNLTACLSLIAVGFNYDLIKYGTSGASESLFIFEIVAGLYFILLRKSWSAAVAMFLIILMYFTRAQSFIYIAGLILFWLLITFKTKKAFIYFGLTMVLGLFVDHFIIPLLPRSFFFYSVSTGGQNFLTQYLPGSAVSNQLRGATVNAPSVDFIKKVFYNLYNFYKLMPDILNPYLFALFVIGLFKQSNERIKNSFKLVSIFMVVVTLLITAASIPFFRYIHPIIPIVYIISVGTVVEIVSYQFSKQISLVVVSTFLILLVAVGQTLGIFLLDSRFESHTHNIGKAPVYVTLGKILKENTKENQVVVTNLDTWGSWYGERNTIWFPLEPKQLIDESAGKIPFDAIYLTSYLMDDENYYIGVSWRQIFDNPTDSKKWVCDGCQEINKEFKLKGIYNIPSNDSYENITSKAILLVKR